MKAHDIFDLRRCHERSFVYNNRDICTLLIYLVRGASSMKTLHIMILFFDCNNFWVYKSDILIKIFDNNGNRKLESHQSDCQFDIVMFIMQLIRSISCSDVSNIPFLFPNSNDVSKRQCFRCMFPIYMDPFR